VTSTGSPDGWPLVNLPGVNVSQVADVRRRIIEVALSLGIPGDRAGDFAVAVNEIVINAIRHGGGLADVIVRANGAKLVVEVRDRGPGVPASAPQQLPPPDRLGGRGLWLARQLSDDFSLHTSPAGTLVRLAANYQT